MFKSISQCFRRSCVLLNRAVTTKLFLDAPRVSYCSIPLWKHSGATGPENWHKWYPEAAGSRQSPIELHSDMPVQECSLKLQGYYEKRQFTAHNQGHIVSLQAADVKLGSGRPCYISGAHGWLEKYCLDHLHWHWGSTSASGSEHSIDGKFFPMELHIVHSLANLPVPKACEREKGLAVLGFMYEISQTDNETYAPVIEALASVTYKELLPRDLEKGYFWYRGSLTTPPCSEVVHWMVFSKAIPISEKQMEVFRTLQRCEGHGCVEPMSDNYRPIQPRNDRDVYQAFSVHVQ